MPDATDATDFYKRVTSGESTHSERVLEHESGAQITVELHPVARQQLLDQISRLPDQMLETISEAEDEEEARQRAEESNMLSGINGNTVIAFETLCSESMKHDELTPYEIEDIVSELSFNVLFEIGAEVMELSFDNDGSIRDFHEVGSDKSS